MKLREIMFKADGKRIGHASEKHVGLFLDRQIAEAANISFALKYIGTQPSVADAP